MTLPSLSIKTLRYYHEVGLLEPAVVDPDSGYRYYRPGPAQSAHLVRRFRDLGLPVADVKAVLAAPDLTSRDAILAAHLDRMIDQLRQTQDAGHARVYLPVRDCPALAGIDAR